MEAKLSKRPYSCAAAAILAFAPFCAQATTTEEIHKDFKVQAGGKLVLDVDSGGIEVGTNALSEVVVDVKRKITRKSKVDEDAFLKDSPVVFTQEGDNVTIRCREKRQSHSFWSWGSEQNEATYKITVPSSFNAQLHTAGGPIAVNDLTGEVKANTSGGGLRFSRLHGPLVGDTSGGAIHANDCEGNQKLDTSGGGIEVSGGGGDLRGATSGGAIRVSNFNGPARVQTSGGGINITGTAGKIDGETSGGSITAALLSPLPGSVNLSTSGGGITIRIPFDASFNLDAETSAGGVSCDLPITISGKAKHDSLHGPVNGGGTPVVLRTSAGGIHIIKSEGKLQAEAEH